MTELIYVAPRPLFVIQWDEILQQTVMYEFVLSETTFTEEH